MSTPQTLNNQTRVQLEELDALLQRMLALPASNQEEAELPKPNPVVTTPVPLPPPTKPIYLPPATRPEMNDPTVTPMPPSTQIYNALSTSVPVPVPSPTTTPVSRNPLPLTNTTGGIPEGTTVHRLESPLATMPIPQQTTTEVVEPIVPVVQEAVPVAFVQEPVPLEAVTKPKKELPIASWLYPVYLANQSIEWCLSLLGPLGGLFRPTPVRNLLGWVGVLMIFGAIGWGIGIRFGFDWTW